MIGIIKDRYLFFKEVQFLLDKVNTIEDAFIAIKPLILNKDINAMKDNHWTLEELREHVKDRVNFWHSQTDFAMTISK